MDDLLSQWLALVFSHPDLVGATVIAAKTAVIYLFVAAGLRLLGTRTLGQMSIYDLVLIVVVANSVQNAMVGRDNSLGGGIVAAMTLFMLNRAFTFLFVQRPEIRRWLTGEPILIVCDGQLLAGPTSRAGLTRDNIMAAMREHGIDSLEDVQMAVLEVDGTISIVPKDARVQRTRRDFRGLRIQ
jgi:uncharacterized membrane protein YcaP (DUF421 family)